MKKRIISYFLIIAIILAAGCSKAPDTNETGTNQTNQNGASESYPDSFAMHAPMENTLIYESDDWRYEPIDETEEYLTASESPFKSVATSPLSTFSADVDTASYSNMRRMLYSGQLPVGTRIEELVNYFSYDYPIPLSGSEQPFSITAEISTCPWEPTHLLAMIGIQGIELENTAEIANNIVFLLDVSGSMDAPNKLPLLQESLKLMIEKLNENDIISIVTYAGSDRVIADSISGSNKEELISLIDNLYAGGSTAGARGIRTAYELAGNNFIEGGNNRIILATDGDFNVGESSVDALTNLIVSERDNGIFISVLGFGMGNLKDNMMKSIASNGNGNYAYIDTLQEAQKVLVDEFDFTMFTIAKDVKLQVEFNPETISQYRLIGYDTRRLENEDFNNDKKDAGEIGSGHSVTVFYELVPVGADDTQAVDSLRYSELISTGSSDFFTVKVRFKAPDGDESMLTELIVDAETISDTQSSEFMFASAVVEFGLIITDSNYSANASLPSLLERAESGLGEDAFGLRAEFLDLVKLYIALTSQ
ncbi:MAG: VWA domain-containing protein [Oscillospiraceae bacterium]|nr:VWA domain-containing protein [Oscillospiraceae bacterium]